jgi:hypothetical protein
MKKIQHTLMAHWRPLVIFISALIALGFTYTFRLSSLTHGLLSSNEVRSHIASRSLHNILKDPLNAPYKLVDYVFLRLQPNSAAYSRITSVLFAMLACMLFGIIVYRWHGKRATILTTALFGTSGWLLHVGRLGTGDILFVLIPLTLILLASWANNTERHGLALLYMTFVAGLAFYTPGAIWFLLVGSFLIRKAIITHLRHARIWEKSVCILITLILAGLLGYAIYRDIHILRTWLFIPATIPAPLTILKQWLDTVIYLVFRGPSSASMWLGRSPILDSFTGVMAVIGTYFYITHHKNLRTRVLLSFTVLGSILVAFNGIQAIGYIIPIVYLLAGTGITYMLHTWLTVFPRNPVARTTGIVLLSAIVALAIGYHLTSYFVAWRYDPATVQAYRLQP